MKTNVSSTSIAAYLDMQSGGKLGHQHEVILSAIKPDSDYSLQELSKLTNLPINCVSGRCNELRIARRLEIGRKRKCSITNITINAVRLPVRGQIGLFA